MNWWKALLSACLFGIATPFGKELLAEAHPFLLASLFYLGAALILLPQSLYLQKKTPLKNLSRGDLLNLLGSLFFGGMVGPVVLLFGLRYTQATNASLLLNLETPATTILAFWFFKENIMELIQGYDVVIDCTDNFSSKFRHPSCSVGIGQSPPSMKDALRGRNVCRYPGEFAP